MTSDLTAIHLRRLRQIYAVVLVCVAGGCTAAQLLQPPDRFRLVQGGSLVWILAGLAFINLVTVMPAYRAMMAGPRRVFAISANQTDLLSAHGIAHGVALVRVAAVSLLGAGAFLITATRLWFWVFTAIALLGLLLLWPSRRKVEALAGAGDRDHSSEQGGTASLP